MGTCLAGPHIQATGRQQLGCIILQNAKHSLAFLKMDK